MNLQKVSELFAAVVVIISLLCNESLAQYEYSTSYTLPRVPCPDIFKYQLEGNTYVGIVTLRDVTYGQTTIDVELTQPGISGGGNSGDLSLNIDENEIFNYIRQGRPVTYRVRFPLRNVIPRVTEITVNNVRICSGPPDRSPKTTMRLTHTLTANGGPNIVPRQLAPTYTHYTGSFGSPTSDYNYRSALQRNPVTSFSTPVVTNSETTSDYNFRSALQRNPITSFSTPVLSNSDYSNSEQNPFLRFQQQQHSAFNNNVQNWHRHISGNTPTMTSRFNSMPEITTESTTSNNMHSICGQENSVDVQGLVIDGQAISRSRYPWIVAIYAMNMSSLGFMCGGSLISTKTVIGAAHCFPSSVSIDSLLLSLGRHNLSDWHNAVNVGVQRIIRHPDFGKEALSYDADVAILQLKDSVRYSLSIRPICLWEGPTDDRAIEGTIGSIVGWGMDETRIGTSSVPKLVKAKIVSELTCIRSNEEFLYLTSNRTLCAGNRDGSGPCLGDSGSGLMIQKDNKWMLRGTVSAALGDVAKKCNLHEYVIYADIAKFNEWIRRNMLT